MNLVKEPTVIRKVISQEKGSMEWRGNHYLVGNAAYVGSSRHSTHIRTINDLTKYYQLIVKWYEEKYSIKFSAITIPYSVLADAPKIVQQLKKDCDVQNVVGQGLSAFLYLRKFNVVGEMMTLVLDGGFNTVNLLFTDGNDPIFRKTYYNSLGVRDLIEKYFEPLLRTKLPDVSSNPIRLDEALRKGYIDHGAERISLQNEKAKATKNYLDDFYDNIIEDVIRESIDYTQIVIVGGLAYFLTKALLQTKKKVVIPEDNPEFLNVQGASIVTRHEPAIDVGFGATKIFLGQ